MFLPLLITGQHYLSEELKVYGLDKGTFNSCNAAAGPSANETLNLSSTSRVQRNGNRLIFTLNNSSHKVFEYINSMADGRRDYFLRAEYPVIQSWLISICSVITLNFLVGFENGETKHIFDFPIFNPSYN